MYVYSIVKSKCYIDPSYTKLILYNVNTYSLQGYFFPLLDHHGFTILFSMQALSSSHPYSRGCHVSDLAFLRCAESLLFLPTNIT